MHAVEAVDEAKAGGGGCGGGSGGGAGQKQGAAAARLRSALEDRVIKLDAARYEERAAVDFSDAISLDSNLEAIARREKGKSSRAER